MAEKFEEDAAAMQKGMLTSPLKYRKMYAEQEGGRKDSAATEKLRTRVDDAEAKAMGQKYKQGGLVRRGYGKARGA